MPKNFCIMQIWAEPEKTALPICNYSHILYQFLTFTQNLKRSLIDMLYTLVPYRRTLCIADNMVVLNDKYMRDNINMTSFKFGGKIKVLGYITNKIETATNTDESSSVSPLAQVGIGLNQIMLSFFGQQSSLNIVHPIAIYYE